MQQVNLTNLRTMVSSASQEIQRAKTNGKAFRSSKCGPSQETSLGWRPSAKANYLEAWSSNLGELQMNRCLVGPAPEENELSNVTNEQVFRIRRILGWT